MPSDPCLALHPDDQGPIIRRCQRRPNHLPPHRDREDGLSQRYAPSEWWDEPAPAPEPIAPASPLRRLIGALR